MGPKVVRIAVLAAEEKPANVAFREHTLRRLMIVSMPATTFRIFSSWPAARRCHRAARGYDRCGQPG
jgi:hypothetical protein